MHHYPDLGNSAYMVLRRRGRTTGVKDVTGNEVAAAMIMIGSSKCGILKLLGMINRRQKGEEQGVCLSASNNRYYVVSKKDSREWRG